MLFVADLHVHTQASDGLLSPYEVVARASQLGLRAIAITDHDTVDGIREALEAGAKLKITVIPGIELSTEYQDYQIHILGFYINHQDQALHTLLDTLHNSRYMRAEKMVKKLSFLGYKISMDDVMHHAKDAAPGRPHVARALMDQGYISSMAEAFDHLIGSKMPGYVERYKVTPQQAIDTIQQAGGRAAWAHPGLTGNVGLLDLFISSGLSGVEAFHPEHTVNQIKTYKQLATDKKLFVTGGSDFHGIEPGKTRDLGCCGLTISEFITFQKDCQIKSM